MRYLYLLAFPMALAAHPLSAQEASHQTEAPLELNAGGFVGVNVGRTYLESDQVDTKDHQPETLGFYGSYAIPLFQHFSLQVDGDIEYYQFDTKDGDNTLRDGLGAVHFAYKDPQQGLFGVFAGGGATVDGGDDTSNKTFQFIGLEGQYYLQDITLFSQAGFLDGDDDQYETIDNGLFARGGASYYFTPNTKLTGSLSYVTGDRYNRPGPSDARDGEVNIFSWGAEFKQSFTALPVGLSASYNGHDFQIKGDESDEPTVHEFRFGAFFQFGTTTLQENDRTAAGSDLPELKRWISLSTNEVD
ncbi:hypothetical protein SAMN04488518_1038 [Pseudovibrio ascidiaceicola]|uniref:Outer membrane protein beta-barrel domain-containing protein n=1 Tax=Pseudovibrio ascidiaceicola TaxID=285279 RepID=A0A1I3XMW4_9HYPH|nr:hypothetical protein [Pseudovibrio ascidiaceicola]SFK20336.1 hypothetical protein SAMN04488518_1038 [Pseudovibrio ascidiaceicola]